MLCLNRPAQVIRSKDSRISKPKWGRRSVCCHGNTPTSAPPRCWSPPRCCSNHLTSVPLLPPLHPLRPAAPLGHPPILWPRAQGAHCCQHRAAGNVTGGHVGEALVSLRQKRLWRCYWFCLHALMLLGYAIRESHGVSIMLVQHFLWYTDSGWSFAQPWMSPVINSRAVFRPVFFSFYYLMTKEKPSHISLTQCILAYSVCISFISEYCS